MRPRPSSNWLRLKRALLSGLIVAILMISTRSALINTGAHFPTSIDSRWTTSPPLIDGNMTPLEWNDATVVNLTSIPGNKLASYLLVKNDASFLYLCYDTIGDDSFDMLDAASMAFDTDLDEIETAGREDQFIAGFRVHSAHLVSDGFGNWTVHDSPVNDSLPNHTGLAVAYGFGQSDFASYDHRIYEFRIPLPLLGVSPGDAIGFLAGSQYFSGVLDYSDFTQSNWPRRFLGPPSLDGFGTLYLNDAPGIVDLFVDPLEQWSFGEPGTSVDYVFTVINEGTMAPDVFDLNISSIWNVTLYDMLLGTPLTDTDSDGLNDTGFLDPGVGKAVLARVDVPPTATGSDIALLNVSSSLDLAVHLLGKLLTEIPIARFTPPHNDYGVDLDSPPDGLYDQLRVEISVEAEVSGAYSLEGYLYDQSKTRVIANAYNSVDLLPGSNIGILGFNGVAICSSGIDGPYLVEVSLFDSEWDFLAEGTHLTAPYSRMEFDAPGAMLNPPHVDYGQDDDVPPNGLFDHLVIEVQVNVSIEGVYWIDVWLGHGITFKLEVPYLLPGLQEVSIYLRGSDIYISGIDGPYLAEINLVDNEFNLLDRNENFTSDYNYTDFDPPGAIFAPPHSDYGLDTDLPPNGLYDHLVINASVFVYDEGLYDVWIDLYGEDEITVGNTTEFLTVGSKHVEVLLNGSHIFALGSDGPYHANLVLFNSTGGFLDYDAYTTSFYSYTDFDPSASSPPPPPTNLSAHLEEYALENVNISWSRQRNEGNESLVHHYDVFYGKVLDWNGNGYELLDSVLASEDGTYYYLHENAGEGDPNNYFYYVCGVSLTNGSSCTSSQVGKFTRPLNAGPNLVSIPLIQSDESIERVLQTVEYDKSWFYNSSSQEWKWYMKSKGYRRGLWNVNHTMGLWVNVTRESNLTMAGIVPTQTTIHLHKGWNLVGFPSFNATYTVADLKVEVGAIGVEGYDSTPPYHLRVLGDGEMLPAGYGYWVKVEVDAIWTVHVV